MAEVQVQVQTATHCPGINGLTHLDLGVLALNLNLNHYFYHLTVEK